MKAAWRKYTEPCAPSAILSAKSVPSEAYYGVQTQRAVDNFPISGLRAPADLVTATILVKKAAAEANATLSRLKPDIAAAIVKAADEILAGDLRDQFVVDVYQAGRRHVATTRSARTRRPFSARAALLARHQRTSREVHQATSPTGDAAALLLASIDFAWWTVVTRAVVAETPRAPNRRRVRGTIACVRRAGAGLIDIHDELIAKIAGENLVRRFDDGRGDVGLQPGEGRVRLGRGFLDEDGCGDEVRRRAQSADREVVDGALRLDAVVRLGWDLDFAERSRSVRTVQYTSAMLPSFFESVLQLIIKTSTDCRRTCARR